MRHPDYPFCRILAIFCVFFMGVGLCGCAPWSKEVQLALKQAGENRGELERVLEHYRQLGDPLKLKAAEFLIANMPGHGYIVAALFDQEGHVIPYNPLDYPNFEAAQAALDALEAEHGKLDFKRQRFVPDVENITAQYLIENIDLAFQAWQEKPWAKKLAFEAFCQHVLPYRGSNEPLNAWRAACLERYADLAERMQDPTDASEAARLIQDDVNRWIRFDSRYYLHPTDQGFDEMRTSRMGRCEDITNMMLYALRANAIPVAADYTPYWANRDNNHAWQVILDENGRGNDKLLFRAAKVYRKTYAVQPDCLGLRKRPDESVPKWLAGKNYLDVTNQYLDTTDVTLNLTAPPEKTRFAYLCVFNGGEWQAIHWGEIDDGKVTFSDMGREVAYLPAYYLDKELVPAGPPFILNENGQVLTLSGMGDETLTLSLPAAAPEAPETDARGNFPTRVKAGHVYELFFWDEGWQSVGSQNAGVDGLTFADVPAGRLYWLVEEGSRKLERIFTVEQGRPVWW